jgi:hypothetical protein
VVKAKLATDLAVILAACRAKGFEGVPEHKFHPERRWRFDLAFPSQMVAFEREGGVYTGGRHTRGRGYEADCEKYNAAVIAGWKLIRATAGMIRSGVALEQLLAALEAE